MSFGYRYGDVNGRRSTHSHSAMPLCKPWTPMQVGGVAIFQQAVNAAEQFNVRNALSCAEQNFCYFGSECDGFEVPKNDIAQNKISHCGCRLSSARHGSSCPHGAYARAVTCSTRHERQSHHPACRPDRISASARCDRLRHGDRFQTVKSSKCCCRCDRRR